MSGVSPGGGPALPWKRTIEAWLPAIVALALFALLAAFCAVDPAGGVTKSNSPFTDEGWNLLNARNFAVLGQWSTDDWNRQYISLPYTLIHAAVFMVAGPGIIQARLVEIAAIAATVGLITLGLRRVAGPGPALLGGIAFATSTLVLYYGRLSLLEPMTTLGLVAGAVLLVTGGDRRPALAGVLAGLALAAAIATKALALASAGGILAGALLVAWRHPPARRRWVASVVTLGIAAAAWGLLVLLPNRAQIAAVLTTLPPESLPTSLHEAVRRIAGYLHGGDSVVALSAPLLIGGAIGLAAGLVRWRRLGSDSRMLLLVATGWFVAGFGLLTVVPYSPSRYVLPALPPLALLIGVGLHAVSGWRPRSAWIRPAAGVLLAAALAAPGLTSYAGWIARTPASAPAIQAAFAAAIPPGVAVEGPYAPLLAMRTSGPTLFTNFGINPGDLYAQRGVRWLVLSAHEVPVWAPLHKAEWAARRLVASTTWGGNQISLFALP